MNRSRRLPARRSLKARALQLLAQREHSRAELRRKLMVHARADVRADALAEAQAETGSGLGTPPSGPGLDRPAEARPLAAASADSAKSTEPVEVADPAAQVEAALDWLEAHNYLSQARFVESRVHARASRFGNLRIRQELAQHAVALSPEAAQVLKDSEYERARAVWRRKYGGAPESLAEQGKQARFLAARGFSAEVIRRLLRDVGRSSVSGVEVELPDD